MSGWGNNNQYGNGGNRGWGNNHHRHDENHNDKRGNDNNTRDSDQHRRRSDHHRESRSNDHSDYNSYGPPPSTSSSTSRRHDAGNVNVIDIKSEPHSHSHFQSHRKGKSQKKRRNYNSSEASNNNEAISKKVKVEESSGGSGGNNNSGRGPTTTALVKTEESNDIIVKMEESTTTNIAVREETNNSIVKREETSSILTVRNQDEADLEDTRETWEKKLFNCYRSDRLSYAPDKKNLPKEAFDPDSKAVIKMKQNACNYAVEQVMARMRRDAEMEIQEDDDDSDDSGDCEYMMPSHRCRSVGMYPYSKENIQHFFAAVINCIPLTIGFDACGLQPEHEKNCHCPCDKNISGWRKMYELEGKVAGIGSTNQRTNHCTKGKLMPIGLMSHVRKEGESCILHYGISKYLEHRYCKDQGNYRGGTGHKAMYQLNDPNYRDAVAAEKRSLNNEISVGRKQLAEEKARRLALEADRDAQMTELELLKRTNKDQYEKLQMLEEEKKNLNVVEKEAVPELDSATLARYKKTFNAYFSTVKSALRSLTEEDEHDLVIETPEDFIMQDFFDKWYDARKNKGNASLLLKSLSCRKNENFHGRKIVNKWNVSFANAAETKMNKDTKTNEDTAIDEGGPTREFLSQCWKQMSGLRVRKLEKTKSGLKEKSVKLFETQDNGVVPLTDDGLREKLKNTFQGDDYVAYLKRAKAYYEAIGRILLHSLANNHTISASAMPPFYQNWLLRGCSPADDDYHNVDVLQHLSEGGTNMKAFHSFVGEEEECDGKTEIITKETVFTKLIPEWVSVQLCFKMHHILHVIDRSLLVLTHTIDLCSDIHNCVCCGTSSNPKYLNSRKQAFDAIQKGLTLNGDYSLCEFLRSFPLEAVQKISFSSPHLFAEDIIAILEPVYCADWEGSDAEKMGFKHQQETFFKGELCKLLIEKGKRKKSKFLSSFVKFCTGYDYLPDMKGNSEFRIVVEFNFSELDQDAYPTSHTCTNTLKLPGFLYKKKNFKKILAECVKYHGKTFNME